MYLIRMLSIGVAVAALAQIVAVIAVGINTIYGDGLHLTFAVFHNSLVAFGLPLCGAILGMVWFRAYRF